MRRVGLLCCLALTLVLGSVGAAQAAVPTLGPVSATNIQGVSALLKGTVDPESLPTTYRFEYSTSPSFAGAVSTPLTSAGSASDPQSARAAISGLSPSTTYHYRLLATNSSGPVTGSAASFATTQGFGLKAGEDGFAVDAIAEGGGPATVAGSHPYQFDLHLGLKEGGEFDGQPGVPFPDGDLRDLAIELPAGMMLNPAAVETCTVARFSTPRVSPLGPSRSGESCPGESQVGTVELSSSIEGGAPRRFGVFNLEAPYGSAAQIGFAPFGSPIVFELRPKAEPSGRYSLVLEASEIPQSLDVSGLDLTLWGTPFGASHNTERGNCLNELEPDFPWAKCKAFSPIPTSAYLTLPVECSAQLGFSVTASSWQQGTGSGQALNRDSLSAAVPVSACATVPYAPTPTGLLTNKRASSPSGYAFTLQNDNSGFTSPSGRAPGPLREIVLTLPDGATINPSVGSGLGVCTPSQFAAENAFNGQGAACPNEAKIGELKARSPLFGTEWIEGAVYLAQPDERTTPAAGAENPFDTMIALYLVAKSPRRGLLIKLAGKVSANPTNGRLTASFKDLPQLPYSEVQVNLYHGQRPFLVTPPACGAATTRMQLTPWAGASKDISSSWAIETGIADAPCPTGGPLPFRPTVVTGGVNAQVNAYTPYFVRLSRADTEQEITSYSLVLPKGVTAKLAGIPFCADAAIEASRHKRGFQEIANPSCPAASQVGRVETGYGVGNALAYAPGRIYLAGPYNGQPLSLVTINAATIGPFDLGTYVIRSAFAVDRRTAQPRIDAGASDAIPHIVDGIPFHLRDIRIYMDRFQFTHNPSSCAAAQLVSNLTGAGQRYGDPSDDSSATVSAHFQLLNCLILGFEPKLGLRLRGGSKRGDYPSLRATFTARGPQDSNLKRMEVITPHSLFLAQEHIKAVCTRVQFAAEKCPPGSVYGKAVAHTPLFDYPLRGEVYLRSSDNKLPDLVTSLRAGEVRIDLEGKIGPGKNGGIRTYFAELPDAPIERFTMTLLGGKRGLLTNSVNICKQPPSASIKALAQNNLGAVFSSKLRGQCGKKKGNGTKGKSGKGKSGGGKR